MCLSGACIGGIVFQGFEVGAIVFVCVVTSMGDQLLFDAHDPLFVSEASLYQLRHIVLLWATAFASLFAYLFRKTVLKCRGVSDKFGTGCVSTCL
jgi:hypothetical protein